MSLTLPSDFPVGIIIGKQGSNIKNIQRQSGANVRCDSTNLTVTFKGNPTQVQTARSMIEQQIKDWRVQRPSNYPHPDFAAIVLSPNFEDAAKNSQNIRFKAVRTPKDTAREHREQMYRLELNTLTGDGDELAAAFGRSLTFGYSAISSTDSKKKTFYARNRDWSNIMSVYQAAANIAINFKDPGFNLMKLRINFGMQLFYTAEKAPRRVPQSDLKLSDVLGMVVGHNDDLRACFSNDVPSTTIDRIRKSLPKLGFTPSSGTDAIVCHGKDMKKSYGLDFKFDVIADVTGKSRLQLREIRSRYAKIAILSFVHPTTIINTNKNPDQGPDFRCRFLGEYPISKEERTELTSLAEGSTWSEATKKINSNLLNRFEFELIRYKKKEIFGGKFDNMKVEIALVNVNDDSGSHWEVEVSSPDYDAKLADFGLFEKIIAFCDKLRAKAIE